LPIRTVAWDAISLVHVDALVDGQVPESRTLEYKQTLNLDDSGRVDFLQDVSAMANAAGGTIVYGAVEGEGEDRGVIVRYQGMALDPDKVGLQLNHLLHAGVDERIHNVLHRALALGDGTYLYVVRVPASPRAPHMVTLKSSRPRFYSRTTISNDPMNMQQIRDAVLRSDTVVERATRVIGGRTDSIRSYAVARSEAGGLRDFGIALVHLLPLYHSGTRIDLAAPPIAEHMKEMRGFGTPLQGNLRWTLEGLYSQYESDGVHRRNWALLMRDGGLEFGALGVLTHGLWSSSSGERPSSLDIWMLDSGIRACVDQTKQLGEAGWFTVPFALSLRLLDVHGAMLTSRRNPSFGNDRRFAGEDLIVEPEVINDWGTGLEEALRHLQNTVWQAFGYQRSFLYTEDGQYLGAS
jgi:hypothetical protein